MWNPKFGIWNYFNWYLPFFKTCRPLLTPWRISFCFSAGRFKISWHSVEQQLLYFSAHSLHCINSRWQPSFLQFVWSSQGLPHWWHELIISSEIRSPNRSSKTKFLPMNLFSRPSSFIWRAYSIMPPLSCYTLLKPICFIHALAFSQRMPPVQYMTMFLSFLSSSRFSTTWSSSRNVSTSGQIAFLKWPTSLS